MLGWRNFVCLTLIAILPASLSAQDAGAAILRNDGGVLVNGNPAPPMATLFPGDTVQVQAKSTARVEVSGSTIDINSETVLQFQSDEIHLDHGSVTVNTSRAFKVRVGCLTVTPVNADWTKYDITDTDGKVTVDAVKSDVNIDARGGNLRAAKTGNSGRVTVREGEQKSREEKCGGADVKGSIAADGALLNSIYVRVPAIVAIGAGTLCVIFCFSDDPISPMQPSQKP